MENVNYGYENRNDYFWDYKCLIGGMANALLHESPMEPLMYALNEDDDTEEVDVERETLLELVDKIAEREETTEEGAVDALDVFNSLGLNYLDRAIAMLFINIEISPRMTDLLRKCVEAKGEKNLTIGVILEMMKFMTDADTFTILERFQEYNPLMKYCLEYVYTGSISRLSQGIKLKRSILNLVMGRKSEAEYYTYLERKNRIYGFAKKKEELVNIVGKVNEDGKKCLVNLSGSAGSGRKSLLTLLSEEMERDVISVNLKAMEVLDNDRYYSEVTSVIGEAKCLDAYVYLDMQHLEPADKAYREIVFLERLFEEFNIVFVSSGVHGVMNVVDRNVTIEFSKDDMDCGYEIWKGMSGEYEFDQSVKAENMISKYQLLPGDIRKVVEQSGILSDSKTIGAESIYEAVTGCGTMDFKGLAHRLPLVFDRADIELSDKAWNVLDIIKNRVNLKYQVGVSKGLNKKLPYGKGVSVLLYGPPGTGKTMCAEVLAKELGMALYRVDLSQLMSKYIGETEKNLNQVFDEAEKGNVILFFDEADALFTKRTEVNDSNDKYANAETAFLLQKMESYSSITILATNLMTSFDPAILRRLTYTIKFELPDKETKKKLWETILPADVVFTPDVDTDFLAEQFELSGSSIKSILYNAAYLAAMKPQGEKLTVSAEDIVRAIVLEKEKTKQIVSREAFGKYGVFVNNGF